MGNVAHGNTTHHVARRLGHRLLVSVLLVGCATANVPPTAPPRPTASQEPSVVADLLIPLPTGDPLPYAVGRIQREYVDDVSVARLTLQALRRLETLAPTGAIRVDTVGDGAMITQVVAGMPDATVAVSWPASPTSVDAGRALDEAARFVAERLNTGPQEVQDALLGGLISVDPEGAYLTRAAQAELSEAGVAGVGLELTIRGGDLTIVAPFAGGPGDRAGLRAGDRIRAVDRRSTDGVTLGDAVRLLRGSVGSRVVLTITPTDGGAPRDITITREVVRRASVDYQALGGHVGYVRIPNLQNDTASEVGKALGALRSQGVDRLVLDLRTNPGGALSAAIEVAELFLPTGRVITHTESRVRAQNMRFTAHAKSPVVNVPLVALIDGGTAAGAEIIAAALQDWDRATLVGTQSFGKATIQTLIPLPAGAQLRLTTARWFTSKGALLSQGLTPDVEVTRDENEYQWFSDPERDSQLRRAVQIVVAKQRR